MTKNRNIRKILSFALSLSLLLSLLAPAMQATASSEVISIRSAEDLISLGKNCSLDQWSQGKIVRLEADIDLTNHNFSSIPTFGGTFDGQGHTISGLSITGSGNVRGLFRYLQSSATVMDVNVKGTIDPSDRQDTLGGLAGNNRGTITNCTFSGPVQGKDNIGGLVGINEAEGKIINSHFSGSVSGEHYVGGIVGKNLGSVIQCENEGNVNITEVTVTVDRETINWNQINSTENLPSTTDIGGIAGFSSGILQSCHNTGNIGYEQVGYNIGGVVGRQTGYLDGCSNSGTVLGQKDVGGIAGQLEPEVLLTYQASTLNDLVDQLDVLRNLMDQTLDDVQGSSHTISTQMQTMMDRAKETQKLAGDLADSAANWANQNIDEINSLSSRISWALDQMTPILDSTTNVFGLVEDLLDQMDDVLAETEIMVNLGKDSVTALKNSMKDIQKAIDHQNDSITHLRSAINHLRNLLGKPNEIKPPCKNFSPPYLN